MLKKKEKHAEFGWDHEHRLYDWQKEVEVSERQEKLLATLYVFL